METIEITVYSFDELNDKAKETARAWYRDGLEYPWFSESIDSIRAFVEHFGAKAIDWSLGERGRDYIKTDISKDHFRGRKLKDFDPEYMPTGYCLDCDLWGAFYKEWERTSDPMYAFEQALEAALVAIARDVEYQFSDEAIDESIIVNGYQFMENGKHF